MHSLYGNSRMWPVGPENDQLGVCIGGLLKNKLGRKLNLQLRPEGQILCFWNGMAGVSESIVSNKSQWNLVLGNNGYFFMCDHKWIFFFFFMPFQWFGVCFCAWWGHWICDLVDDIKQLLGYNCDYLNR